MVYGLLGQVHNEKCSAKMFP